ncbi:MAG: hypothetical protein HQ510_09465 [Candidatus Marinimicrobia bacterium]|nr:hypothetical protein [Candidatus Neomarinimicrobiota bacterium]
MKKDTQNRIPPKADFPYSVISVNFLIIVILFIIFFYYPNALGEDLYYHLKIASLIKGSGLSVIQDMRWFQLTTWSQYPADLSLGFHLILVPLLTCFSPIVSIKILGITLILLFVNIFYWILHSEGAKVKPLWIFLLLLISTFFLYRLAIVRPFIISISFSLLIFASLIKGKKWLFILTCILFPFFYTGWLQIFILLFFWIASQLLIIRKFRDLSLILIAIISVVAGLILRPDFPNILYLTYQQIVDLLFLNFKGIDLNVGIGQRTADIFFFQDNIIGILLMTVTLLMNYFNFRFLRDETKKITLLTLSLITVFYFIWSIESVRFIEYWIPFSILFTALSVTYFSECEIASRHWSMKLISQMKSGIRDRWIWKVIFVLFLVAISYHGPLYVLKSIKHSKPVTAFQAEAQWLAENTLEKSNVFITSWDSFSRLFFYNHHNNYTVGMDPVFFYLRDPERFWLWRNITEHTCVSTTPIDECPEGMSEPGLIAATIKSQFDSDYIFSNNYSVYFPFVMMMVKNPEIFHFIMSGEGSFLFSIDPSI